MSRAFWFLFAIATISAPPAKAERDDFGGRYTDTGEHSRRDTGDFRELTGHDGREDRGRGHKRALYSGPGVIMVPGASPIGPPMGPIPFLTIRPRAGFAAMAMPIAPPPRFRYFCSNPPGYFPAVAACSGPWLELGALSTVHLNRR
jgi:hypothetical protein